MNRKRVLTALVVACLTVILGFAIGRALTPAREAPVPATSPSVAPLVSAGEGIGAALGSLRVIPETPEEIADDEAIVEAQQKLRRIGNDFDFTGPLAWP